MNSPAKRSPRSSGSASKYQRHKARQAEAQRRQSEAGRDIIRIPPVADLERKLRGSARLADFCKLYFPRTFSLPWSGDHLEILAEMESILSGGGLGAIAMPRGSGKTSLVCAAAIWAALTGRRRYCLILGADERAAANNLRAIKRELGGNDLLAADWPEVCFPVHCLGRITQRAGGQLFRGRPTDLIWSRSEIVLPSIPGSLAAGSILQTDGLLGAVRGPRFVQADGSTIRPSAVILDDVQTDESARSPFQTDTRLKIINGAVLNLAGPGVPIAAFLLGTVIEPADLMDRVLDRRAFPEWRGIRKRLVYSFPTDSALWERYSDLRAKSLRGGGDGAEARAFYRANREAMDAGAAIAWPERRGPADESGIQHCMDLMFRDRRSFFCEMQNAPEIEQADDLLTAEAITHKLSGIERGAIPAAAAYLVAHIDVHDKLLYTTVAAFERNFTGAVVDYFTFPRQRSAYFTMRSARATLQTKAPPEAQTKEGAILAGLRAMLAELLDRTWSGIDGAEHRIQLVLIDCGYLPDVVEAAIQQDGRGQVIVPSRGVSITAMSRPMGEWRYGPGDRKGPNLGYFRRKGRRFRVLEYDTNHYKSFNMARLAAVPGEPGSLSLFGRDPAAHRLYADHLAAEIPKLMEAQGRRVMVWSNPRQLDNHWLDCQVGCLAAAAFLGAGLTEAMPGARRRRKRKIRYH